MLGRSLAILSTSVHSLSDKNIYYARNSINKFILLMPEITYI